MESIKYEQVFIIESVNFLCHRASRTMTMRIYDDGGHYMELSPTVGKLCAENAASRFFADACRCAEILTPVHPRMHIFLFMG